MNKHVHRLVFDRRRGMRVPAAEHVRSAGKTAGGETGAKRPVALACSVAVMLSAGLLLHDPAQAQQRRTGAATGPQRSMGGSVQRAATLTRTIANLPVRSTALERLQQDLGNFEVLEGGPMDRKMVIKQGGTKITINWDSFDVGPGYTVEFQQPDRGSALNNIWSGDPSVILGSIKSNGEVILQNRNGILFGPTARVDTGRFVAAALSIAKENYEKGLRAVKDGSAAFGSDDENKNAFITIERGAEIKALSGGDVIMVAPKLYNEGRIETPAGQTILAAGKKVYLYANTRDAAQKGLMVAVDAFNLSEGAPAGLDTVEQAEAGEYKVGSGGMTVTDPAAAALETKINQVIAEQGTINLVGMTVRQNGVLSATTAVKGKNGTIYLQGMKDSTATLVANTNEYFRKANQLGTVDVGAGSITSVTPDMGQNTQTSSEVFYRSRVNISGKDVRIGGGALVQAVSGNIEVKAAEDTQSYLFGGANRSPDGSTLVVEEGATLSTAGLKNVLLPMSRNQLSSTLFRFELADSPVQRDGPLYRMDILADARKQLNIANVQGSYNLIGRTAQELSTRGGNVLLASAGTTVVTDGSKIDISGGSVRYADGSLYESTLSDGRRAVKLEDADPTLRYTSLSTPVPDPEKPTGTKVASYVEGADAGSFFLYGNAYYLGADVDASAVVGPLQRGGLRNDGYASVFGGVPQPGSGNRLADELGWSSTLKAQPWLYASLQPQRGALYLGQIDAGFDKDASAVLNNDVRIHAQQIRSVSSVPEGGTDEAAALFASLGGTVDLSAQQIAAWGLGSLTVAGRTVTVADDVKIDLGAGGSFNAHAVKSVSLAGSLRAEGGQVELAVEDRDGLVKIASGSVVDMSGRVADERFGAGQAATSVDGGKIKISSQGSVDIDGASLDVSGGLLVRGGGSKKGKAGSLDMAVNAGDNKIDRHGRLSMLGTTLLGHDFDAGGALKISGVTSLAIGTVPPGQASGWTDGLALSETFFSSGGFGTFQLSALGDVGVFAGTQIRARKENLSIVQKSRYAQGESAVAGLSVGTLEEGLRSGIDLSLGSSEAVSLTDNTNPYAKGGKVMVEEGASIDAGLGGAIKMTAGRGITVAGALIARGGKINLSLHESRAEPAGSTVGYLPDQEIRLSGTGVLDVSGASKTWSSSAGRKTGEVLGGGEVTLGQVGATYGSVGTVVTEKGSLINLSGASDTLNIGVRAAPVVVRKGAGDLTIDTADGYLLQGDLRADRPDETVSGGSFHASLASRQGIATVQADARIKPFPSGSREALLLGTSQDVSDYVARLPTRVDALSQVMPVMPYGQGLVSTGQLQNAGFDRVTLVSEDRITLGKGADFSASASGSDKRTSLRSLTFDTRVLGVDDGAKHTLEASYVALGSTDLTTKVTAKEIEAAAARSGSATLDVVAALIDLKGYAGLAGVGTANLSAVLSADQTSQDRTNGEIRLIGRTTQDDKSTLAGQLNFTGKLNMTAGALYATTLTDFTFNGIGSASELNVRAPQKGSTSTQPLSALGKVHFKAQDLLLDGPVYQPFGQITANAPGKLEVGQHARLSVSGDDGVVPVGSTLNQARWTYNPTAADATSATDIQNLDDASLLKLISLHGDTLKLDDKAVLSAKSGGDLQAWEFVPGVGGTSDELTKQGYFAILPNYHYDFAPYDAEVMAAQKAAGTMLTAGDQVTIATANGVLARGTYTLLPARYALMPGAVLVKAAAVSPTTRLTQAVLQADASVMVAGFMGSAGTRLGSGDATSALVLTPQATLMARSQYKLTSINDYKNRQAVLAGGIADAPANGGRIQLIADQAFNVGARFELTGGELDLYMGRKMAVVAKNGDTVDDHVAVSAEMLDATGAQRILIGGVRTGTVGEAEVEARSDEVLWNTSIDTRSELLTVASNRVAVADGVVLRNVGQADETAQTIVLKGQGAALALTNRVNTDMRRTDGSAIGAGALALGQNVTLTGNGVLLDASGEAPLPASLSFTLNDAGGKVVSATKALSLGAGKLLLGETSTDKTVLSLTTAQLASLAEIQKLSLHATKGITTSGSLDLGRLDETGQPKLASLMLDAPEIIGKGQVGDKVTLTAQQVTLKSGSAPALAPATGEADLLVVGKPLLNDRQTGGIDIAGDKDQRLSFRNVTLDTTGDVVVQGGTSTLSAQGDLTIKAARVTGTNLADKTLKSGGVLTVAALTPDRHTLGESRGAGASLALEGRRVVQAGNVDLASGRLTVKGTGVPGDNAKETVIFQEGATTNVSGRSVQAGTNWKVSTAGGDVTIQALAGEVRLDGSIDVSAGAVTSDSDSAKSAGSVDIQAFGTDGKVTLGEHAGIQGHAARDALSGELSIDTLAIAGPASAMGTAQGSLDAVAKVAGAGQMAGSVSLRLRGEADQTLNATLAAQRVNIGVDKGGLTLMQSGRIDASAPQGGVVGLFARDDVTLADGALIKADATRAGSNGGDVLLSSVSGSVIQSAGATVSAKGDDARDGRIVLRAGIDTDALAADEIDPSRIVKISVGDTTKLQAGEVVAEAVMTFDESSEVHRKLTTKSSGDDINQAILEAADGFLSQMDGVDAALGFDKLPEAERLHLRLGVEVRSTQSMALANDWDLSGLRTGDQPIMLTIRSAGDLAIHGSVSDGVEGTAANAVNLLPGDAASYRLVAGADLGGADLLATLRNAQTGDLTVAGTKTVRTTSGSIEMAAAHDVKLMPGTYRDGKTVPTQGTVYVTGRKMDLADTPELQQIIASEVTEGVMQFTDHGGRLEVTAGHDVTTPSFVQLPGNWFVHSGGVFDPGTQAWGSLFDSFKQGFGSFGGGNVTLRAANNISNAGVVAPSSSVLVRDVRPQLDVDGQQVYDADGNPLIETSVARRVQNGGDVTVKAGGNIQGGVFLLSNGEGLLKAGRAIEVGKAGTDGKIAAQAPMMALMNGEWTMQSRADMSMGLVFNPTMMAVNNRAADFGSYFYTYGEDSALHVSSAAGSVAWNYVANVNVDATDEKNWYNLYAGQQDRIESQISRPHVIAVAPPRVDIAAGGGDLAVKVNVLEGQLVLYPSAVGNLSLYAAGDLNMMGSTLIMAKTDPAKWPGPKNTLIDSSALLPVEIARSDALVLDQSGSLLHLDDATPVRIYGGGDFVSSNFTLDLAKRAEIEVGGDVVGPQLVIHHLKGTDRSLLSAGGSIEGSFSVSATRNDDWKGKGDLVAIYGPGEMRLEAGRDIDLKNANGINAGGNISNDMLPDVSARISLLAGAGKSVALEDFQRLYLNGDAAAQSDLIKHVRQVLKLGVGELTGADAYDRAWALYGQMSKANQVTFAEAVVLQRFVSRFISGSKPYAQAWQEAARAANVSSEDFGSNAFKMFKDRVVMDEVVRLGTAATDKSLNDSTDPVINARNQAKRQVFWDELNGVLSMAGLGKGFVTAGNVNVASSLIFTRAPGDKTQGGIDMYVPSGDVIVGLDANDPLGRGIVTEKGGSIRAVLDGSFQVNSQKAFVIGTGDLTIYDMTGQIDNGRGSNTAVAAPPAKGKLVDGYLVFEPGAVTTGSGMAILSRPDGSADGNINLLAPIGGVSALDTFLRNQAGGGSVNLAGPVKGANNIKAGSVSSTAVLTRSVGPSGVPTSPTTPTSAGDEAVAPTRAVARNQNGVLTVELLSAGSDAPAAGTRGETATPVITEKPCPPKQPDCHRGQ